MEYGVSFKNIKSKLKLIFSDGRYIKIIVVLGICGMLMILFSEFAGGDSKKTENSESNCDIEYDTSEYTEKTEKRLREILQQIDGVGKAEIMLTVNSTEEYVYAEEIKSGISQDGDKISNQNENQYVFKGNSSDKEALVKKIISPQINGVVIVCEGGDKSTVAESIYEAVSTALDISSNKIYVAKIK